MWTRCEKQSKRGRANPIVATGLFTQQATSNSWCNKQQNGTWLHFLALRRRRVQCAWGLGAAEYSEHSGRTQKYICRKCIAVKPLPLRFGNTTKWMESWRTHKFSFLPFPRLVPFGNSRFNWHSESEQENNLDMWLNHSLREEAIWMHFSFQCSYWLCM